MSRTTRLFALIETLRRHRRPVTAAALAEEQGVSVRTIYRDVQTLIGLGAPIDGEAGIGYLLRPGFFLPPLMFGEEEIEALVLGARWVERQGDPGLAAAARGALAKIATAASDDRRDAFAQTGLWAATRTAPPEPTDLLRPLRSAIRREEKLEITYRNEAAVATRRIVWPIALAYLESKRLLAAWCELRRGFRHFRPDRIESLTPIGTRYPRRRAELVRAWRATLAAEETAPGSTGRAPAHGALTADER